MTLEDRVKSALAAHPDHNDLRLLIGGWSEARKRYAADKSSANRREWKALEKDLVEILDSLETAPPEPGWRWCEEAKAWPDPLQNRNQVVEYWKAMGWVVSRSGWYGVKGKTCPPTSIDGWSQVAANEYARVEGKPTAGTPSARWTQPSAKPTKLERMGVVDPAVQIANLNETLKLATIRGKNQENELRDFKIAIQKGELVPASELHDKQCALAIVMYERIKEELGAAVPVIIRTAGGDPGLHVPVAQALRDTLDKGMRAATAQESFEYLMQKMRN